jgi:MATE family multidrug resistance protein
VTPGGPLSLRTRHDREIAALAVPALGALIADPLLSLVDTAFVGRVGATALGALGVSAAVFGVTFWVFNFVEYGTTATVARAVGASDDALARRAGMTALWLAVIAGLAGTLVLEVLAGPILGALGASGDVRAEAIPYLRIRALAAPAVLIVRAGHGIYRGYQDTRTPFVVSVGLNLVNLVLDPLLIFGAGWGIAGAAWATVVAQYTGAAWFLVLLNRRGEGATVRGARPVRAEVRAFLVVGRDLVVRTGSLLAVMTLASAVATRVGDDAIAAHQVLNQMWLFLALALDALAVAGQAMVGRYLGRGDAGSARAVADRLLVFGIAGGALLVVGLAVIAPFVPGWFGGSDAVHAEIRSAYWLMVAAQPIGAVVFVWDGVFMGAGDFGYLAAAMVACAVIGVALLVLVLPLGWGLAGVWWGIVALLVARVVTLAWRRVDPRGPLARR